MKFTLITFLAALLAFGLSAQQSFELIDSEISIAGTSNIHDWVSTTSQAKVEGTFDLKKDQGISIPTMRVKIPVETIKSSKGRIMDNKTYDALQTDRHANITFVLKEVKAAKANALTATGALTIAGQTRTITLDVNRQLNAEGVLTFKGKKALKMTDFGVDPPTALLGTLKTGDDVTVTFQLRFRTNPAVTGSR